MLITFIPPLSRTGARRTIGVSENRAVGVISVVVTDGWQVLSTHRGLVPPGVDGLQFAGHVSSYPPPPSRGGWR